ncbi:phosphotransferase family protein [Streptomyces sp. NPDC101733]|uniref:phosphotransferase family protein n=1 Tax=unclassified Streptomyces TaxID=2593676 RepID=UPI00380B75E5
MTAQIHRYFQERGFSIVEPLGQGMEGVVYDLGGGRIGKVWFRRGTEELETLQAFYRELESSRSPIAFPEIFEVRRVGEQSVTIERKLSGDSLRQRLDAGTVSVEDGKACVLDVPAALREIKVGSAARRLAVVDEGSALCSEEGIGWAQALIGLMDRKVSRFRAQLQAVVTDFDAKYAQARLRLGRLPQTSVRAVHGDLVPENVMVDADGRPVAVLDWGFLSTAGDPAFEAALAAALFDMYGTGARDAEEDLPARIHESAGYGLERMRLYRAVYAMITGNAYDPHGQDGHFAWCAASLNREDIVAALSAEADTL